MINIKYEHFAQEPRISQTNLLGRLQSQRQTYLDTALETLFWLLRGDENSFAPA